jgi:hypothetical protein
MCTHQVDCIDSITPALRWIQYLSFFRYAFEALVVNDLTDLTITDDVSGSAFTVSSFSHLKCTPLFDSETFVLDPCFGGADKVWI